MIDWRESKKKKNEEIHWREREREREHTLHYVSLLTEKMILLIF
jgi:hypothetical protein